MLKKCTWCLIEKEIMEFHKNLKNKDCLCTICKKCKSKIMKKYYRKCHKKLKKYQLKYKAKYPEKIRILIKKWFKKHPGYSERYNKKYREENAERCKELSRKYREEHPEECKSMYKKWRKAHPEKVNEYSMRRYATKLNQTPPNANFELILAFYTRANILTKETGIKYEVHHIKPLKANGGGGLYHQDNLQVLRWDIHDEIHRKLNSK